MMQLLSKRNNQAGAYLPLMALGIVALLGVAALSIDSANMFYTKLQYKKATDAAVVAALEYRVNKGYDASLHTSYDQAGFQNTKNHAQVFNGEPMGPMQKSVIQRAREIARDNALFSMPSFKGKLTEEDVYVNFYGPTPANNSSEVLQVEFKDLVRNNLLMTTGLSNLLGGSTTNADTFKTSSASIGDISPVQVVLMVDLSNSMMCPVSYSYYQQSTQLADCEVAMQQKHDIELGIDSIGMSYGQQARIFGFPIPGNALDIQLHKDVAFAINKNCYCGCLITDATKCPNNFDFAIAANAQSGNYIINTVATKFSLDNKMNQLIQGVDAFMERFRPNKDNIAIIPFNSASFVYKSMAIPFNSALVNEWDVGRQVSGSTSGEREVHNSAKLDTIFNSIVTKSGNLKLGDWTNPSDALLSAYIHNLQYNSDSTGKIRVKTHYVLFTDGAPSATRILLQNPNLPGVNFANDTRHIPSKLAQVPMDYDVTLLSNLSSYRRYVPSGPNAGKTPRLGAGGTVWSPSTFLKSQKLIEDPLLLSTNMLYGLQVNDAKTSAFSNLFFGGAGYPDPEEISTYPDFWSPGSINTNITMKDLKGNTFNFNDFIQGSSIYEANITSDGTLDCIPPISDPKEIVANKRTTNPPLGTIPSCTAAENKTTIKDGWMKVFYNVPIFYSDVMRANNGTVHTIGFGEADPCRPVNVGVTITYPGCNGVDGSPYQNYLDAISRKDLLLGRIAGRNSILINVDDGTGKTNELQVEIPAFPNTNAADSVRQGSYSAADENFSIVDAFGKIADDIVRLSK